MHHNAEPSRLGLLNVLRNLLYAVVVCCLTMVRVIVAYTNDGLAPSEACQGIRRSEVRLLSEADMEFHSLCKSLIAYIRAMITNAKAGHPILPRLP